MRVLTDRREDPSEDEIAVLMWRFERLVEVGYPLEIAQTVAFRTDVDLHYARRLVMAGCSPELAARILL